MNAHLEILMLTMTWTLVELVSDVNAILEELNVVFVFHLLTALAQLPHMPETNVKLIVIVFSLTISALMELVGIHVLQNLVLVPE